ncbi:unnamed protein product, partial [Discosporangium mesarthrocarpum]
FPASSPCSESNGSPGRLILPLPPQVVFKDTLSSPVSALLCDDYRMSGFRELIVCASDGEVRGYIPTPPSLDEKGGGSKDAEDRGRVEEEDEARIGRDISEMRKKQSRLSLELRGLQGAVKAAKNNKARGAGAIPLNTEVKAKLQPNTRDGGLELLISTNNEAVIASVVAIDLDGGLFEGETLVVNSTVPSCETSMNIRPARFQATTLTLQVHVGTRGYPNILYAFELEKHVPKFGGFSHVIMKSPFLSGPREIKEVFTSWGSGTNFGVYQDLWIQARKGKGVEVRFRCDSMELAGEVLQDLCRFTEVTEVQSVALFPHEMETLRKLLESASEYNNLRHQLTADMADNSHRIKALIVRAEDARILGDMPLMRRMYAELFTLNKQCVAEYSKRANNHQALLAALKEVNQTIQKASNLRVGKAKTRVVTECRAAIKSNNVDALVQIMTDGFDP